MAVITSAGFTLLGEAVYLHKPVLAIPVEGQFEQILNAHYVDWAPRFPPVQSAVIDAASKTGATVVSTDPIYMYGNNKGRPYTEDLPYADKSLKGRIRGEMADQLLEAHLHR